jgi:ribonucleoside-diphosphate reductase alpha chain
VGDHWEEFVVFHHKFIDWMKVNGYNYEEVKNMSEGDINAIVAKSPYYKATANDVDWVAKVRMQGAIQKWVDHSISVTINLPAEAKEELVSELYLTPPGRRDARGQRYTVTDQGPGFSSPTAKAKRKTNGRR